MKYKEIKENERFKHVIDLDTLKTYAIMKKVPTKLLNSIINCGYIEYNELDNIKAIYHCDCVRHLDDMVLLKIWDQSTYTDNLEHNIVKKRRRYISSYFKNFKVLRVHKSLDESNIYFMFSQNLPCMLSRDKFIEIINIRSFKSGCIEEKDYFETKIKIAHLY